MTDSRSTDAGSTDATSPDVTPRDLSFDAAIAFAQELIRTPGAPGAEGDVAARVMRELIALGFHHVRSDEVGNVIGVATGRGERPPVMLSSHLDVVDVGEADSWEYGPFDADIADGHLHGRGAMDIKGPLALQTYAAAHFVREPGAGDVIVAHTVLEERGGWGMAHLISSGALLPGAVIIGESTGGDVCIGHRGRAELIIEIAGVAGHASAPERARNPLHGMPAVIAALHSFSGTLETHELLGPSTAAPTTVETLPRSRNVIPDRARIVLDWRVLPDMLPDEALDRLRAYLDEHVAPALPEGLSIDVRYATECQRTGTGREDDRRLFTSGFLLGAAHLGARAAARSITKSTGRAPAVRPWTFATDCGHTCGIHGIPTIGFAPGEERYAHTNRERLELASARVAYDAYPPLIRAVLESLG
ncbi:YgeY family selenium metabolism-linked hydrolase [soil metagenome]